MARTLKELAQEAIAVQDACNPRAVARGLVRALDDLDALKNLGTDALCAHAITRAWVDKLASLAGIQDVGNEAAIRALDACQAIAEGKEGA
jgi:hypothetical protein